MNKRMKRTAIMVMGLLLTLPGLAADSTSTNTAPNEHMPIGHRIAKVLHQSGWPDEAIIVTISTLPIVELRGAIPVGHILMHDKESNMPMKQQLLKAGKVYVLAVLGNMIPIPFILLLLGPFSRFCMRWEIGRKFFEWLFARTRRKTANIEKYETLGLTIFVAIPLPVTGGWTGAMAAFLMGIKFHHAMWSILFGVMIAGVIMTAVSFMGWMGALLAGVVLIGIVIGGMLRMFKREESAGQ